MSDHITAYPLQWPPGWPTTESTRREAGVFKTELPAALSNLRKEVERLGGKTLVLSSNYTLGATNPAEPGVVAYFTWQDLNVAIPCDRWRRLEHNVQAIALTIEAMRGMERWGAKHMIKALFTGFKALPAPSESPWWQTLGVKADATPAKVREAFHVLAKKHHPDAGGDPELFRRISAAWEQFQSEHK